MQKKFNLGDWVPYVYGWQLEHTSSETWEEGQNGRSREISKRDSRSETRETNKTWKGRGQL